MIKGKFIDILGERFYEITNYDEMQPFFISLASDTDLWMYLASTGGLTAGRRSPEEALFPYYTDDKITENYEHTGPQTVIHTAGKLWRPFSEKQQDKFDISRRIAKSTIGNKIVFCEENHTLGLRFSYMWAPAGRHGWVRRTTLENFGAETRNIDLTDSLLNVLPSGVERKTQNEFSTLVDGYKKTELVEGTSLVLFRMEAILVDRAEPSESLRCNTVYALGLPEADYSASASKGVRGAFVAHAQLHLDRGLSRTWYNVADVSQDAVAVHDIMHFISQPDAAIAEIERAIQQSTDTLQRIVAQNDGVQHTADEHNDARHFANVLFNTMRGGYYLNYPPAKAPSIDDPQALRHYYEYLPLTFGRRHGDPSRPWNMFNIRVQDDEGNPVVSYQGNWRDIFQNWEALSVSYPLFINHIIAKFLNATTVDGYNPYKVTSEGIEWEVIEPENPWSNIGYWGDHQIIYLLKLLELSDKHNPEALHILLGQRIFAFANVPYRLKSYKDIVADPKNSINFDTALHKRINALIPQYGADARLVMDGKGEVMLTTMADKLLITLLAKFTNFIPDAGIWMNTLRPEWNDANNALVGYGASMVTLCYMRRYVAFMQHLLDCEIQLAEETACLMQEIDEALTWYLGVTPAAGTRRQFIDRVGMAGENYRRKVYAGLSGRHVKFTSKQTLAFLAKAEKVIDDSIRKNKREDGLYHAYNLVKFTDDKVEVSHLYEMLEGQVAVLSSGLLGTNEAADLLDAMRHSALYREDQRSYMLYPDRRRKSFLELNNIPEEAKLLPAVQTLLAMPQQTIILQDCNGGLHFNGDFHNADFLTRAVAQLNDRLTAEEISTINYQLSTLFEQVFNHHAFTGRSGTFYKYEGLGCIYWHMVSKLLLAVGECIHNIDINCQLSPVNYQRLKAHYNAIREGIGSHKQPQEYGSFPFDPYSHTPSMAGVQQPGMTGQVKEDILNRFFELGVYVHEGQISFNPHMLTDKDFLDGELHFTYCSTPVVYRKSEQKGMFIETADGNLNYQLLTVNSQLSHHIFARDGYIKQIVVQL